MSKEDIKLLIKQEYENGTSIRILAEKYNQKVGTIKSWISRGKWIKTKQNIATSKKKNATTKRNQLQEVANDKEIQIKKDILKGKSKKEIMSEYDISERTYQRKAKSIRQARLEKTERYLDMIAEKVYPDLEAVLENTEKAKRNLVVRSIKEVGNEETNIKKIQEYNKAFNFIKQMANDIMRTGKILTPYELLEIDKQLNEEELQQQKLDIERLKNEDEVMKDTKVEFNFKTDKVKELEEKKNDKE
jgi:putative pbsx phage terminase small subunit